MRIKPANANISINNLILGIIFCCKELTPQNFYQTTMTICKYTLVYLQKHISHTNAHANTHPSIHFFFCVTGDRAHHMEFHTNARNRNKWMFLLFKLIYTSSS